MCPHLCSVIDPPSLSLSLSLVHCFASQTVFATCHSKFGHSKFNRRNQDIMLISDQQNQQLIQQTDEHTQPKNSLLVYQQSAPTFPLCNPVLSARTGKLVSSAPFSSAPFSTAQIAVSRTHRQTLPIVIPGKIGERNSFEMKKEEFICEALEWSKQVSTKIKGSGSDSSSTSRTDVGKTPVYSEIAYDKTDFFYQYISNHSCISFNLPLRKYRSLLLL